MSAQEKIMVYQSTPAKIALTICHLTMPAWAIAPVLSFIVSVLIGLVLLITKHLTLDQFTGGAYTVIFGALLFVLGTVATGLLQESKVIVSQDGLFIPILSSASNHFDRFIEWRDIEKVILQGELSNIDKMKIRMLTAGGGVVTLGLNGLSGNDIEYLLVSMANWLPDSILDPQIHELKEALWNADALAGSNQNKALSFTQMWEDELTSRYSSTAYIPLNPGQRLQDNNLKVVRQLALGGWSAIYLVQEANTKLKVLKESVIPPGTSEILKEKAQSMFLREAQLLLKLSHPQIVRVYEHFVEDNRHYLLLDYVSGQTVKQAVKLQGPYHQLDVIDYAQQMAEILIYLHNQTPPVLHRDLTPDNLIIDNQKLTLIDFGAANEMLGTATGTMVGKQSYIAPEQFQGHATEQSDLYALGATLYFMLTGVDAVPMTQSSLQQTMPTVSKALNKLVEDLTAQDQANRPASATEVKARLATIQN
jgi:tRNA A-37 threonylcarbamoyl transferase component Bud32